MPPSGFGTLVSVGMGPEGPVAMWAGGREGTRQAAPGGRRDLGKPGRTVALASYTASDLHPARVVIAPLPVEPAFVQPLPDGGYLVARSRCAWTPQGPEKNAAVVDQTGRVIKRGTLGDGIAHLQVDRYGRIWVGYFDEGIAGNLGWGFDGPEPLGSSGLVRWSLSFDKEWEFPAGTGTVIMDCYALNVSDDGIAAYVYDDFSLIRVRDDVMSIHPAEGADGATSIIFSGDTASVIGSYSERSRVMSGTLGEASFDRPRRGHLAMPDGRAIPRGFELECRGSTVNLFAGNDWYQFDQDAPTER